MFAQEAGYLDLTDPVPRQRLRSPNGGLGGYGCAGGGDVSGIPEVTLSLVSVDKRVYSLGEDITFEVKVQNTGKGSVEVPWTPHLADLEPGDPTQSYEYRSAVVVLNLRDPDSERYVGLYGFFYGSAHLPETIRILRPSESFLIRARSRLEFYEDWWRQKVNELQPLPVRAEPGFMLNTVTYSPNEKGEPASEDSSCIRLNTKKTNQIDVVLWPRSPQ